MKIIDFFKKIGKKIKEFIIDENGGNLVEYILLIGFALFIFFILVIEVTGILDWTVGLSNDLMENVGG
ncbi:MAG: hypothetical protein ACFFAH_09630 [Promethearchaeota archaeon]